jgi:hypothetical protein
MRTKVITRQITPDEVAEVRSIVAAAKWKFSTSEEYKDAPHSYIIKQSSGPEWDRLAFLIKHTGVYRTWRGNRMKYLVLDGKCYWIMWPVLNRAEASTLDGYEIWGTVPSAV